MWSTPVNCSTGKPRLECGFEARLRYGSFDTTTERNPASTNKRHPHSKNSPKAKICNLSTLQSVRWVCIRQIEGLEACQHFPVAFPAYREIAPCHQCPYEGQAPTLYQGSFMKAPDKTPSYHVDWASQIGSHDPS